MRKIIALSLALVPMFSFASDNCSIYFDSIDSYLSQVAGTPSMKAQLDMVKRQYEQSKKQIQSLPEAQREAVCSQGLNALKMAEEQLQQMQKVSKQ